MAGVPLSNLGEFLQAYPGFAFDLEEYVLSTTCAEFLRARFQRFEEEAIRLEGAPVAAQIAEWIQARGHASIPAYRNLPAAAQLEALPLLDKQSLRAEPVSFLCERHRGRRLWRKTTTGSSGQPIPIWYGMEFYFDLLLLSLSKIATRAGLDSIGSRPVFSISISDIHTNRDFVVVDATGKVGISLQVVIDERQPESLDRAISLIDELSPVCISSKPSVFEMLLAQVGDRWAGRTPKFLVSGGSLLEESLREALELKFRSKVINVYGMTEFGVVASECQCGGLHVDASAVHAELVDETGRLMGEGEEGEIVLSSIANRAMPLLRYRTGDMGRLTFEVCKCGSSAPRLQQLSGRRIRCFLLRSGGLFSPTYFNDLFDRFSFLREFQISQLAVGRFEVLVELGSDVDRQEGMLAAVERYVSSSLPGGAEVAVTATVFRRDSKFERYRTSL